MVKRTVIIQSETGIHARPASELVKIASGFSAEIDLVFDQKKANAKSMMSILTLGLLQGSTVEIVAKGHDAVQAVDEIIKYIEAGH